MLNDRRLFVIKMSAPAARATHAQGFRTLTHNIPGVPFRDLSRLTLNAAPIAVALSTLTGLVVHANPAFHALFDLPTQMQPEGMDLTTLCSNDAAAILGESVARDGQTRHCELEMQCGERGLHRILCVVSRVDNDQGTPVWLAWACLELQSQRLVGQQRLHELHHLLDVQHLARHGSWQVRMDSEDLKTNPMVWSPALSQFLGQPPQITERPVAGFLQHLHPQDRAGWLAMLQQAITSSEPCRHIYRLISRDGVTLTMRSHSRCVSRQPGRTGAIIGVEQDLTEIIELQEKLTRSTLLLNTAIETNGEPLYAVDRSLRYICFNAAYCDSMRRDRRQEPVLGERVAAGPSGNRQQRRTHDHLRRALTGQQVVHAASTSADDSETEHCDRDVVYQPLLDQSGEITGVMVTQTAARPPSRQRLSRHWQD